MISNKQNWSLLWLLFSLTACTSCDRGIPHFRFPWISPSEASQKAMVLYDTNRDGKIAGSELDQAPGLKAALRILQTDREQGITCEQLKARIQQWVDSKIGRTSLVCRVTHNGQPLDGAIIKFIPEKFLADDLTETATGITNKTGMAKISFPLETGPDALPPGVSPGIYRVEITKEGETIPARYNTNTELGVEVSLDNSEIQKGIKFDLQY